VETAGEDPFSILLLDLNLGLLRPILKLKPTQGVADYRDVARLGPGDTI
jgi:hypothetical protein